MERHGTLEDYFHLQKQYLFRDLSSKLLLTKAEHRLGATGGTAEVPPHRMSIGTWVSETSWRVANLAPFVAMPG